MSDWTNWTDATGELPAAMQVPLGKGRPYPPRTLPTALRLVAGLLLLIGIGTLLLLLPGMATRRLQFNEALFTAASALTVTGLSIITPSRDLTLLGQIVLLVLIQIGGVGFMAIAVITLRLLGRRIGMLDRVALRDSLGLANLRALLRVTRRIGLISLAIEAAGAALLWLNWRGELGDGPALFYALFHAVSAFCNAGFDLFSGLPQYPGGLPNDNLTLLILGLLILSGGLGIPVLDDLFKWPKTRRFSLHSRVTLRVVALLVLGGGIGLFLGESGNSRTMADLPLPRQLALALFQSVSARTAGFTGVPSFEALAPASQALMIALMFIGCAPASMGGGITTGTLAVLAVAVWGYARGLPTVEIEGRSISLGSVRKAAAVLTISLLVVGVATWLILLTQDATLDAGMFEVVSAFATCGLSLAFTGQLNGVGQAIIIVMMIWGRLGALTIIIALAQRAPPPRVRYPEESLLIG